MPSALNHPAAHRMRRKYPTLAELDQHLADLVQEQAETDRELGTDSRASKDIAIRRAICRELIAEYYNPTLPGLDL